MSVGLSMYKVKQRGFKQRFKFREYETETGHLGLYYDFPQNLHAQLLLGKYLAGDKGATLEYSYETTLITVQQISLPYTAASTGA